MDPVDGHWCDVRERTHHEPCGCKCSHCSDYRGGLRLYEELTSHKRRTVLDIINRRGRDVRLHPTKWGMVQEMMEEAYEAGFKEAQRGDE